MRIRPGRISGWPGSRRRDAGGSAPVRGNADVARAPRRIGVAASLGLTGLMVSLALAASRGQEPADEDEARFFGRRAFLDNCLICHGEGMASRQRLTAKQWSAEVDKMIGWGAPVPPESKSVLLTYLAGEFSEKAPPPALDAASPDELLGDDARLAAHPAPRGDAGRGGPLYAQNCAACHGAAAQGGDLGPRLAGRPALLADAHYDEVVAKGLRRMPGFATVLKPGAGDDILAWLRALEDGAPGR